MCDDLPELTTHTHCLTVRGKVSTSPGPSLGSGKTCPAFLGVEKLLLRLRLFQHTAFSSVSVCVVHPWGHGSLDLTLSAVLPHVWGLGRKPASK